MSVAFDTLKFAQTLRDKAKLSNEQAEGISQAFAEASSEQLATKADIGAVRADIAKLEAATKADFARLEAANKADLAKLEAANKADLAKLESSTKADIGGVRADIAKLEAGTKADFARLEAANKAELRNVETRLEAKIEASGANLKVDILRWLVVTQIALAGFIFAAMKFVK